MFNSYWNSSSYFGYNPFSPMPTPAQAYPAIINSGSGCYNPHVRTSYQYICTPTSPEVKASIDELRNYVIALESSRRLEDLKDVEFDRPVQPGDVMYYEDASQQWELTNYSSGGEW
jgi:hypothetical protein